ncbi:hypothetical protein [Calothrix sp. NIES-2098]|uniref:hypothetical protein n=1 Tax=Calothrix sp. NIES-2098 TaxID=1954171 RepID=UPI000B5FE165|nr:VWA containing CoxE family protein [Calothrix sp. NIES-2098]
MNDPALLELFTCLREAGLPLGLAEYHLLLQAVHAGFGTHDRTALAQLCCALWVKSEREKQIFQDYFDQIIPQQPEQFFLPTETVKATSTDISFTTNQTERATKRRHKASRIIWFSLLGFTTCIIAIGGALFLKKYIFKPPSIDPSKPGSLEFSSTSFLFQYSNDNKGEKAALIKITRSDGSYGVVSAKLNAGKQCSPNSLLDEQNKNFQLGDLPSVVFKDGDAREKTFLIPIIKVNNANSFAEYFLLCLTDPKGGVKLVDGKDSSILAIQNLDYFSNCLRKIFNKDIFEPLLIVATCIILLLVVGRIRKIRHIQASENEALVPQTYTNLPKTMLSPEVIRTMADEIQVAKTIRQSDSPLSELFPLIVNNLPVTHRQMKQGWRHLRQFSREGPPIELDMEATIQQVAQQGVLLNPVLVPRRTNRIELLLLIDRDGSMVPFHHLSQELADTALRGGRFSQVRVYYFHNCPDEYLYRDRYHLEAESIDDCLSNLPKTRTVCLIFSDAGAARGGFSSRRRRLTKFFLKELGQYVRYIAWLNPVPRDRWETTTAHDIAALVSMFEVNRQEFYSAIDVLRGRHRPSRDGQ